MNLDSLFAICKAVLTSTQTLIITIAVVLYINLVCYVCHYRKRVKIIKQKKAVPEPEKKAEKPEESEEEESNLKEEKWEDSEEP